MAHLATMMQGFHPFRTNDTVFQKTVAINDFYWKGPDGKFPLGQIQSQGRTHGVMAQTVVPQVPVWAYEMWVARGVDWLAMSEDLPRLENRVTIEPSGDIRLHYRPNNVAAHEALVRETKKILRKLGFLDRGVAFAQVEEHHAPVRHAGVRHRSARIRPRHLLPDPRHRQPIRRRCLVLSHRPPRSIPGLPSSRKRSASRITSRQD